MTKETQFRRWRRDVALTQAQAAKRPGLYESQVENLEAGQDRTRRRRSIPSLAVRHLMRAIAEGKQLELWPTDAQRDECAVTVPLGAST